MELLWQIAVLCAAGAVLSLVIRQGSPVMALVLSLGLAVLVLSALAPSLGELLAFFRELEDRSGLPPALLGPLYKTVGIAAAVRIGGDLCRDAGESALGAVLEAAGTVCALLTALPLLQAVLEMLLSLME